MRYYLLVLFLISTSLVQAEVFTPSYELELKQQAFIEKMEKIGAKLSEEDRALMKAGIQKMMKAVQNPGLKVGEKAPEFVLANPFGKNIVLKEALKSGPVILVFYRGAWCPYCNLHLKVLRESLASFEKYNAQVITITPQQPDKTIAQFEKDGYPFEVLSDLDYSVMKAYNLYFDLPEEIRQVYNKLNLDVEAFNGEGRTGLPVPASIIIDQNGIIAAIQADANYKQRMEPRAMMEALEAL